MKTKWLITFLLALLIMPMCEAANRRILYSKLRDKPRAETRFPVSHDIDVNETGNCLQITFLFSLKDADLTLTDKNGNVIVSETRSTILQGKTIYIPAPDAYPYLLEIVAPTVEITGEIVSDDL